MNISNSYAMTNNIFLQNQTASVLKAQENGTARTSEELLAGQSLGSYDTNARSFSSEFGYRVDEQGIFEKSLNKAANLPQSYDINLKSVQSIAKEFIKNDSSLSFSRIDLPQVLNAYHSALKSVESEFSTADNSLLSRHEISKLNQGFSTKSGEFNGQIARIYTDAQDLSKAQALNKDLNPLVLDNKIVNFHFDSAINNTATNELIKPYLSENGEVSKAGLFMNFIHKDLVARNERVDFFIEPVSLNLASHTRLYDMIDGKASFDEYIKNENKKIMSFDLYLYVNGVNKQSADNEKLSLLYQQYLNYHKNININEFATTSSIYKDYADELNARFDTLKEDFLNQDKDILARANESRNTSIQSFFDERKRMANLNKITKSYMSVMS